MLGFFIVLWKVVRRCRVDLLGRNSTRSLSDAVANLVSSLWLVSALDRTSESLLFAPDNDLNHSYSSVVQAGLLLVFVNTTFS